jgi:hypothetical protein
MIENRKKLSIPSQLFHPLFFSEKEISLSITEQPLKSCENFYFELLFYNGMKGNKPWTNSEQYLPLIHEEWQMQKREIENLYRQREKSEIIEAMKKGIGLFLQFLYWSNGKPVYLKELPTFSDLSLKPVNLDERAGFIISRPSLYHSFIQLCELMVEQEKLLAKADTMKKTRRLSDR